MPEAIDAVNKKTSARPAVNTLRPTLTFIHTGAGLSALVAVRPPSLTTIGPPGRRRPRPSIPAQQT